MKPKLRVLWIDDGAITELAELTGPVYASGKYDLTIATNISDAITQIQQRKFDAVVVDIRLPPGNLPEWKQLYHVRGNSRARAGLGLEFLISCFGPDPAVKLKPRPGWLKPHLFGVLTVEGMEVIGDFLKSLGIAVIERKTVESHRRTLLNLIEKIHRYSTDK